MSEMQDGRRKTEDGRSETEDGARLDAAINRAVREMLDVEQPAGLRGRVLRRMEAGGGSSDARTAFRRKIIFAAIPLGAAAVLILALLPTRTPEPARPRDVARAEPVKTPAVDAPAVGPGPTAPAIVATPRHVRSQRPAAAKTTDRAIAAAVFLAPAEGTTAIASLEAIDPIQVAPIAEHRVAPAEIAVRPLSEITEVQIAPLITPAGRF